MHAMFRSDNLEGIHDGKYLASLRISADNGLDNGLVVKVGALEEGSREVRACTTPAANDALGTIAILGSEEVDNTKKYNAVGEFTNKKGSIARGYILTHLDTFSVTADALEAAEGYTYVVGTTIVELQAKNKLKAVSSATSGSTTIGKLEAIEPDGDVTWYVFRVL